MIIGNKNIIEDLDIHIKSKPIPHMLFYGPSGCGKTMFAEYIAKRLNMTSKSKPKFLTTTGGGINSPDDIVDWAYTIGSGDIFFIDEIHNLAKRARVREVLYEMMDRFTINGSEIKPFTLIGATTDVGQIPFEFRERFMLQYRLSLYSYDEIKTILETEKCPKEIALEISKRSRGTPRIALNFLKRIQNECESKKEKLNIDTAINVFKRNGIDDLGLNSLDRKLLRFMNNKSAFLRRNAIGSSSLADQLNIRIEDLKQSYEPYLIKIGFIDRTNRGRILTQLGKEYIDGK